MEKSLAEIEELWRRDSFDDIFSKSGIEEPKLLGFSPAVLDWIVDTRPLRTTDDARPLMVTFIDESKKEELVCNRMIGGEEAVYLSKSNCRPATHAEVFNHLVAEAILKGIKKSKRVGDSIEKLDDKFELSKNKLILTLGEEVVWAPVYGLLEDNSGYVRCLVSEEPLYTEGKVYRTVSTRDLYRQEYLDSSDWNNLGDKSFYIPAGSKLISNGFFIEVAEEELDNQKQKTPWAPAQGEEYWTLDKSLRPYLVTNENTMWDLELISKGRCYKDYDIAVRASELSHKAVEEALEKFKNQL